MIRGYGGERLTPKQKAAELVATAIAGLLEGYWIESEESFDEDGSRTAMTELEIERVVDQLAKYQVRIDKIIGYSR